MNIHVYYIMLILQYKVSLLLIYLVVAFVLYRPIFVLDLCLYLVVFFVLLPFLGE